jgi:hypothetical protein
MITVNSLSGGKTSSYMAIHYPADYNVFALVTIEDPKCSPSDKGLIQKVSDKLGKEFIATAEDDKTLQVIFDIEQMLGREIIWLTGISFDGLIKKRKAIPNKMWRFCTTEMKMRPIWNWWYKNYYPEIVSMNIGFRYDEKERAKSKEPQLFKGIVGKHNNGDNKWLECEWKVDNYPLIDNKIGHYTVKQWADGSGLIFPEDSNCVGCFWKPVQQLRKNYETNPLKMQWFADQEHIGRWKTEVTYEQIKKVGLQQDFFFGTGSGCQAGYCTD